MRFFLKFFVIWFLGSVPANASVSGFTFVYSGTPATELSLLDYYAEICEPWPEYCDPLPASMPAAYFTISVPVRFISFDSRRLARIAFSYSYDDAFVSTGFGHPGYFECRDFYFGVGLDCIDFPRILIKNSNVDEQASEGYFHLVFDPAGRRVLRWDFGFFDECTENYSSNSSGSAWEFMFDIDSCSFVNFSSRTPSTWTVTASGHYAIPLPASVTLLAGAIAALLLARRRRTST